MKHPKRLFLLILGLMLAFFGGVFVWLQSPKGQDFVTSQVSNYLSQKIKSKALIGKIRFDFPNWFLLENVYVQDLQKDTLFYADKIYFALDAKKIWQKNIYFKQIKIEGLHTTINRLNAKSDFNYGFIVKAFASVDTNSHQKSKDSFSFDLKDISLINASIRYADSLDGVSFYGKLGNFQLQWNRLDLDAGIYGLNRINLHHARLFFKQTKPLVPSDKNVQSSGLPAFQLKQLRLSDIHWDLEGIVPTMQAKGSLGQFLADFDGMDLPKHRVDIREIRGKKIDGTVILQTIASSKKASQGLKIEKPWQVQLNRFSLTEGSFAFKNSSQNQLSKGFNPNNLQLNKIHVDVSNIKIGPKIQAELHQLAFVEKCGLVLKNCRTSLDLSEKTLHLSKFKMQTNHSEMNDDLKVFFTPNHPIENTRIALNLVQNKIAMEDILLVTPSLIENLFFKEKRTDFLNFDGNISGKINELSLKNLKISGLGNHSMQIDGMVKGLPDIQKTVLNLSLRRIELQTKDFISILGDSLRQKYDLPDKIIAEGNIVGKSDDANLDVRLLTGLGELHLLGNLQNFDKKSGQNYDVHFTWDTFDWGKLLKKQQSIGIATGGLHIVGTGLNPGNIQAKVSASFQELNIASNNLENIQINTTLNRENIGFEAFFDDDAIKGSIYGNANTADSILVFHSDFDTINLKKIQLSQEELSYGGKIDATLNIAHIKNPVAKVSFLNTFIAKDGRKIEVDRGILEIHDDLKEKRISFKSPFLSASWSGRMAYEDVQDAFLQELNKYFLLPNIRAKSVAKSYQSNLDLTVFPHPLYQIFVPLLQHFEPINLKMEIDSEKDSSLVASFDFPFVKFDSTIFEQGRFDLNGGFNKASYFGNIKKIQSSSGVFYENQIFGKMATNNLSFALKSRDSLANTRFSFAGNLQNDKENYLIRFSPETHLLDYQAWQADSSGGIFANAKGFYLKNIGFTQNRQKIELNSSTDTLNAPINVRISNVDIQPIGKIASQDSSLVKGILDGNIQISEWKESGKFIGNLSVKNFEFTQIPIGDLNIHTYNSEKDMVAIDASIKSKNNDISLNGKYHLNSTVPLDLGLIINKLGAETIEAFSLGQLKNASGNVSGNLKISGSNSLPSISGKIHFDTVRFNSSQLGASYLIQNQSFSLQKSKLIFDKFNIIDSLGQELKLKGYVSLQQLPNFDYDLQVDTKNFMFLNGSRKDNEFFYGKGFADAQLSIKGINTKPSIEGNIKIKGSSDITFVMPDREIEKSETEGIVEFIQKQSNITVDTLAKTDNSLDFAEEISLNIEVDNQSQLNIIVDELNGDYLKVKGKAQLNTGITTGGQSYILGLYELNSGTYDVSFQLLRKQFSIEKGSTLLWTGDPMQAQIDIKAIYRLNAEVPRADKSKAFAKTPLELVLKMSGNLSNPAIDFEIRVDENAPKDLAEAIKNDGYLNDLKQNPVEMNKQVFSLLVLNNFMSEQSNDFFSSINPEAIARQSVSKLLSDQLNFLAGDIIKGVKLNFDLNSTVGNSEAGTAAKTDLNIGLSKGFMNNRLKVAVGRNFQLENTQGNAISNELIDNLSVNYNLSKDGRYQFSAYRKNQYQAILDGFVVETGMAFTITLDYELFKELFKKANEIQ